MVSFPANDPSFGKRANWGVNGAKKGAVFYAGETVSIPIANGPSGATSYTVVHGYYGTAVTSGSLTGTETTITPAAPAGGWLYGPYLFQAFGSQTDPNNGGHIYTETCFTVLPVDSRFKTMPVYNSSEFGSNGEAPDFITKAVFGAGTTRLIIGNLSNLASGDTLTEAEADAPLAAAWWTNPGSQYLDNIRPRSLWCTFPNGSADSLTLPNNSAGTYATVYPKAASVDGSKVFVTLAAGSVSGAKITVSYPNNSTVVETYDNQASAAAAAAAINAASAYIWVWPTGGTASTQAVTAIGNTRAVNLQSVVTALYPLGVTHYEGPANEFLINGNGALIAQEMKLFYGNVKAAQAAAVVMGPSAVTINSDLTVGWTAFLAAGGGDYCDEIATHMYGCPTNGLASLIRNQYPTWKALLTQYGQGSKTVWNTESVNTTLALGGVYAPRRARAAIITTLLLEQQGVARENAPPWYDGEHGFWGFPSFATGYGAHALPTWTLYRALAAETWQQQHAQTLSFGTIGDECFIGSVYAGAAGKTAVLATQSYMPSATVTLTVSDSGPLTMKDAWGNAQTLTVTDGRVVVPVEEVPHYLELSASCTVAVYTCNDWPQIGVNGQGANSAGRVVAAWVGNEPVALLTDGAYMTKYGTDDAAVGVYGPAAAFPATTAPPTTVTLKYGVPQRADRAIIVAGTGFQYTSTLVDFDIQTSSNGTDWTTQVTITKTAVTGPSASFCGCWYKTFWDEQWIFGAAASEKFAAPVVFQWLRLNIRATSYGGGPDAASFAASGAIGYTSGAHVSLQEVLLLCDNNTQPHYATLT